MKVRKAVIPAAGLGTRFLPATKAMAKEMLPIIDKPTIQFIVDEALEAGIEDILIVTGKSKRTIEDHFDSHLDLEKYLIAHGMTDLLEKVQATENLNLYFVRQPYPKGLGHAVLQARAFVGNEPFVVMLGDDLMVDDVPLTRQLIEVYEQTGSSNLAVMEVPQEDTANYGVIAPDGQYADNIYKVDHFVEKPQPEDAPSNLAIIGRYLLTPEIFEILAETNPGAGNEIQLTDAIDKLNTFQNVYARQFNGKRYDVGSKFGFLEYSLDYALQHPEIQDDIQDHIIAVGELLESGDYLNERDNLP